MEAMTIVQLFCLVFASGPPDFYMSKYRQNLACKSASQIIQESQKVAIDPSLVMALITVESNWKSTAVSKANASGHTQVIPKYTGKITKKHTCEQLKVPKNSIHVGIKTLKYWIDYHKGNVSRGLCSYNAGYRCSYKKKQGKIIKRPNKYGMRSVS